MLNEGSEEPNAAITAVCTQASCSMLLMSSNIKWKVKY